MCKYNENEQAVTGETQANVADTPAPVQFYQTVKVGDKVKGKDFQGTEASGVVVQIDEEHPTERLMIDSDQYGFGWLVNDSVEPADALAEAVSGD